MTQGEDQDIHVMLFSTGTPGSVLESDAWYPIKNSAMGGNLHMYYPNSANMDANVKIQEGQNAFRLTQTSLMGRNPQIAVINPKMEIWSSQYGAFPVTGDYAIGQRTFTGRFQAALRDSLTFYGNLTFYGKAYIRENMVSQGLTTPGEDSHAYLEEQADQPEFTSIQMNAAMYVWGRPTLLGESLVATELRYAYNVTRFLLSGGAFALFKNKDMPVEAKLAHIALWMHYCIAPLTITFLTFLSLVIPFTAFAALQPFIFFVIASLLLMEAINLPNFLRHWEESGNFWVALGRGTRDVFRGFWMYVALFPFYLRGIWLAATEIYSFIRTEKQTSFEVYDVKKRFDELMLFRLFNKRGFPMGPVIGIVGFLGWVFTLVTMTPMGPWIMIVYGFASVAFVSGINVYGTFVEKGARDKTLSRLRFAGWFGLVASLFPALPISIAGAFFVGSVGLVAGVRIFRNRKYSEVSLKGYSPVNVYRTFWTYTGYTLKAIRIWWKDLGAMRQARKAFYKAMVKDGVSSHEASVRADLLSRGVDADNVNLRIVQFSTDAKVRKFLSDLAAERVVFSESEIENFIGETKKSKQFHWKTRNRGPNYEPWKEELLARRVWNEVEPFKNHTLAQRAWVETHGHDHDFKMELDDETLRNMEPVFDWLRGIRLAAERPELGARQALLAPLGRDASSYFGNPSPETFGAVVGSYRELVGAVGSSLAGNFRDELSDLDSPDKIQGLRELFEEATPLGLIGFSNSWPRREKGAKGVGLLYGNLGKILEDSGRPLLMSYEDQKDNMLDALQKTLGGEVSYFAQSQFQHDFDRNLKGTFGLPEESVTPDVSPEILERFFGPFEWSRLSKIEREVIVLSFLLHDVAKLLQSKYVANKDARYVADPVTGEIKPAKDLPADLKERVIRLAQEDYTELGSGGGAEAVLARMDADAASGVEAQHILGQLGYDLWLTKVVGLVILMQDLPWKVFLGQARLEVVGQTVDRFTAQLDTASLEKIGLEPGQVRSMVLKSLALFSALDVYGSGDRYLNDDYLRMLSDLQKVGARPAKIASRHEEGGQAPSARNDREGARLAAEREDTNANAYGGIDPREATSQKISSNQALIVEEERTWTLDTLNGYGGAEGARTDKWLQLQSRWRQYSPTLLSWLFSPFSAAQTTSLQRIVPQKQQKIQFALVLGIEQRTRKPTGRQKEFWQDPKEFFQQFHAYWARTSILSPEERLAGGHDLVKRKGDARRTAEIASRHKEDGQASSARNDGDGVRAANYARTRAVLSRRGVVEVGLHTTTASKTLEGKTPAELRKLADILLETNQALGTERYIPFMDDVEALKLAQRGPPVGGQIPLVGFLAGNDAAKAGQAVDAGADILSVWPEAPSETIRRAREKGVFVSVEIPVEDLSIGQMMAT
ncbi:MAG: hypothetical protein HYT89_06355, partial [Candidatus Omnitrophica bacterium]|nr:hypothetical protein [Candidatus Omnitrophota bacterium]